MHPRTESTRAANSDVSGTLADAGTGLVRLWQSIQLYGVGHARCREAADASAAAFAGAARDAGWPTIQFTPDSIVLRANDRSESTAAPGLAEACALLNIVQIEARQTPDDEDLIEVLTAVHDAAKARRRSVSHEFGSQDVAVFRVTVLSLAGVAVRDSPTGEHGGVAWEDLAELMLHPEPGGEPSNAGELLERLVPRTDSNASGGAEQLAKTVHRLKESNAADRQGAIARLRSTLAQISPELRAELTRVRGPDALASMEDLAEVLPVGETCDTLAELDERHCHLSDAAIRLVRRLAGMASGTPVDLRKIASLADAWSGRTPVGSHEQESFSALADLCREATRADFIPAEYEARLNEIAAGTIDAAPQAERLLAQDEQNDEAHAGEVLLAVAEDPDQADDSVLDRLAATAPAFADAGRPDLLLRARALTRTRDEASPHGEQARGADECDGPAAPDLLAHAIARCVSTTRMAETERAFAELAPGPLAAMLVGILTDRPTPEARGFAMGVLRRSLAEQGTTLLEHVVQRRPALLVECVELMPDLEPERAFGVIRTALAASTGRADYEVLLAANAIPHRWPDPLIVRGLIAADPRTRLVAVHHAALHGPEAVALVCQRLVGSLSDVPLDAAERAEWIRVLAGVTSPPDARAPLSLALRYAAWRPTRAATLAGRDLWDAMRRERVGFFDRVIWAVAPARLRGGLFGHRGRRENA